MCFDNDEIWDISNTHRLDTVECFVSLVGFQCTSSVGFHNPANKWHEYLLHTQGSILVHILILCDSTLWDNPSPIWLQTAMARRLEIHCWPRVRNILFWKHKSCTFVWLVYFYGFYELLNDFMGGYCVCVCVWGGGGGGFWFNQNLQNTSFWLTFAPPNPDTGRVMLTTFWA